MPNVPKGEVRWTEHRAVARITIEGKERESFPMPTCKTPEAATERCAFVAGLAARLRKAGVIKTREGLELLKTAAACPPALLDGVRTVAGELIGGEYTGPDKPKVPTFAEMGRKWTSGELHKLYPDHVKHKDSDLDASRLEKLCAADVGGMKAGEVPIDRFGLDHAEAMMRGLPDEAKRPGTRRGYAQIISRVMALAVYPCRHIAANPLPKGFLPKVGKPPAYPFLYPLEDAALLAAPGAIVPLCYRLLWGFLSREGCREGEAVARRCGSATST